ncbi:restriction endonuclease, partial [Lactobacillus delbrueckii subsp. allosunkii]
VGCMFGRFSLKKNGVVYASKEQHLIDDSCFEYDKDNIIPITDDDYFTDDIVGKFVDFTKAVYGSQKLEENLAFIANALDGKGTAREKLRNYFLNSFYQDHCAMYSGNVGKRPIYWLFDSGKKNGFKCLIYMHRYTPDTLARIRTDYVHPQQARYQTAIDDIERQLVSATGSEKVRLNKQLKKLKGQAEETRVFEEKLHHLADQMIDIDLDDGVKHNYALFKDVLAKIK